MPQYPYALPAGGTQNMSNLSASTVVKAAPGQVCTFSVTTAGSAAGSFHDCTTTGAAAASNATLVVPNTVGNYTVPFRHAAGIVFVPGSGQVISVSYQ